MNNIIQIKNLSKNYYQGKNSLKILRDINLNINSGEKIALVGASGCGKSSFLQLIGLLDQATSGEIFLLGDNYSSASDKKRTLMRKKHIGFIYQFHHLLPEFNIVENTMLPLIINGVNLKNSKTQAITLLTSLGLEQRLSHKPSALSGGEQQRVAIARALIHNPDILLADEPTGNLDPENANNIFQLFMSEINKRKQTTIIATHNLELAKKFDKILTIENGQIIQL